MVGPRRRLRNFPPDGRLSEHLKEKIYGLGWTLARHSTHRPFVSELKTECTVPAEEPIAYWGEATDPGNAVVQPEVVAFQPPADQPTQARDSLTKTVPKARIIP